MRRRRVAVADSKSNSQTEAWRSGSAFYPINEVTLRRAGLLLGWVNRQVNHIRI